MQSPAVPPLNVTASMVKGFEFSSTMRGSAETGTARSQHGKGSTFRLGDAHVVDISSWDCRVVHGMFSLVYWS